MQFRAIFGIALFIITSQTILISASKEKSTSNHKQHDKHDKVVEKKSKATKTNKPLSILPKKGNGAGLLAFPSISLAKVFGVGGMSKLQGNVTTKQNRTTKINGPFKTVTTVTQQFTLDKKNKSKLVGQSVESVTSAVKSKKGNGKNSGLFFDYNPFGSFMFDDKPEPQCTPKKPCKKKGTYCDQVEGQCKPTKKPGSKCDQPKQCSTKEGKYACIWGTCSLVASAGHSGRFCKKDSDCDSEDMQCVAQNDVSEVADICVPKSDEGQTCGKIFMMDYWPFRRTVSRRTSPCKKGLKCVVIGYSGRMVCRPGALLMKKKETVPKKTKIEKNTKRNKHEKKESN